MSSDRGSFHALPTDRFCKIESQGIASFVDVGIEEILVLCLFFEHNLSVSTEKRTTLIALEAWVEN